MEDSQALLKLAEALLEKHGFDVDIASNGRIGLQKVLNHPPDLALIDLMMPEIDGFEAITTIHASLPNLPIIAFSAHPPHLVEKKALNAGAVEFLQKPLKEATLMAYVRKYISAATDKPVTADIFLPFDNDQPYKIQVKCCHICGYDHVNVFQLRPEAIDEDWRYGLFPIYHQKPGFQPWNHLRTMVSVCPSCLFSSIDAADFAADSNSLEFPYKMDAKKILARNITTRKKMVDAKDELCLQFTNPNRRVDLTIKAFQLAERCANGLVLGDKDGVYCDLGECILLRGVLQYIDYGDKSDFMGTMREALNMFLNQLKINGVRRKVRTRAYYFIITLHIALSESIKANEMKLQLEQMYLDISLDDTSPEENLWNERLQNVWTNGVDLEAIKNMDLW